MASIRVHNQTNKLFFDFRYKGKRYREYTALNDNKTNHRLMEMKLRQIVKQIESGTFDYAETFPGSKNIAKATAVKINAEVNAVSQAVNLSLLPNTQGHPTFSEFAQVWITENEISWRESHKKTQLDIINGKLIPAFGEQVVSHITKADVLTFRAELAKVPGRKNSTLSPKRINAIMTPLRQILNEAADRYEFNTPYRNIKPLKVPKSDVEPFPLYDVNLILSTVREDYRNYYLVRFFTAMRTGEIDGLQWQYVDFDNRLILIRETIVNNRIE